MVLRIYVYAIKSSLHDLNEEKKIRTPFSVYFRTCKLVHI